MEPANTTKGIDVPEGWVLVPIEPTADMLAMGDEAMVDTVDTDNWLGHCRNAWAAMIAAAPDAQPAREGQEGKAEPIWFGFDENTGEFTGEYSVVKPHDTRGMVPFVRANEIVRLKADRDFWENRENEALKRAERAESKLAQPVRERWALVPVEDSTR